VVSVLARANKKELITQSLQLAIAQLDNGNPFFQQAYLSCLRGGEYNGALGRLHGIIKSHRMQLDTAWAEAGAVGGGGEQAEQKVASPALAALAAESDMAAAALTVLQVHVLQLGSVVAAPSVFGFYFCLAFDVCSGP